MSYTELSTTKAATIRDGLLELGPKIFKYADGGGPNKNVTISFSDLASPTIGSKSAAVKTTLTTESSGFTSFDRLPEIVQLQQQRITVTELIPSVVTTASSIRYQREDSYTNAAAITAEGAQKPEASFDLSEVDAPIRKIAVIGRVSDEFLSDYPAAASFFAQRLAWMVAQREESQILSGDGTGNNLTGILNTPGIQTQAVGTDAKGDTIFKAITKVRNAHFEPDGLVINPNDYQTLRLLKDSNNQLYGGGYFYVPYAGAGVVESGTLNVWGLRTIVTTAVTAGTALVGCFNMGATLFRRLGMTLNITNSDGNDFTYNRSAYRVEVRTGLGVLAPAAFCSVSGL